MKVEDIMVREVRCCAPTDTLNRGAQIMWEGDCGCVAVLDADGRVIGMLTDRDICMAAYTQGVALNGIAVSSAMSREVFSCLPNDDLLMAQRLMQHHRVRRLPVTDTEGKVVGILSLNDLARALARTTAGKAQVADTLIAICAPHQPEPEPQPAQLQHTRRERSRKGRGGRGTRRSEPSTEGTPHR